MKRILVTAAALLIALGLLACDDGEDGQAGVAQSESVYRLRYPADSVEAHTQIAALLQEENLFKSELARQLRAVFPEAAPEALDPILNYLWLVSLNKERYERSLAYFTTPAEDEGDPDYPINADSYLQLLQNFHEQVSSEHEREAGPESADENAAWKAAWRRKATERHYSLFMEDFLVKERGRWELKGDSREAAVFLWPLRENQALFSQALDLFNEAPDREKAVKLIQVLAKSEPEQALKAVAAYKNEIRFSMALGFVADEGISLALEPYFADLAAQIGKNGSLKPAISAAAGAGAAFKEGPLPNGLKIRRLKAETLAEAILETSPGQISLGLHSPYYTPGRSANLLEFLPLLQAPPQAWKLVPLDSSGARDPDGDWDKISKAHPTTLFISEGSGQQLAAHLASLGLVLSEREIRMRGKSLVLNDTSGFVPPELSSRQTPPQLTDPEGETLRLANPLNSLFFASLAEQAPAEQADMIMGPASSVIFYTREQGWLLLERADPALAGKWVNKPRPLPGNEKFTPFRLDKSFLRLLSKRQTNEQERLMIYYLAREDERISGRSPAEAVAWVQPKVSELTGLLDKHGVASLSNRRACYFYLSYYLERAGDDPQTFMRKFEEIMQLPNLTPMEKLTEVHKLASGAH